MLLLQTQIGQRLSLSFPKFRHLRRAHIFHHDPISQVSAHPDYFRFPPRILPPQYSHGWFVCAEDWQLGEFVALCARCTSGRVFGLRGTRRICKLSKDFFVWGAEYVSYNLWFEFLGDGRIVDFFSRVLLHAWGIEPGNQTWVFWEEM